MFPRSEYPGNFFSSPIQFERSVWSELSNTGTIVAPRGNCSYWGSQYHRSCNKIDWMYLFKTSPVTWFRLWVDIFLSITECHCQSIQHIFLECSLLHEELNAFNRIAGEETFVTLIAKVTWISQMTVTHFAQIPSVNVHRIWHLSNILNTAWDKVMWLTIAFIGFLKSSLLEALLKLYLPHQCTFQYSFPWDNTDYRPILLWKISKHFFLIGLRARWLSKNEVPQLCSWTGGWSGMTYPSLLLDSVSLE